MTTLNLTVADGNNNSFEAADGQTFLDNAGTCDDVNEWIAWRFNNVTVPQGATITSALLSVMPKDTLSDEPDHPFYAEDADDAAVLQALGAGNNNISGRARTAATVTWSSANLGADGATYFSPPDLVTLVQEVVDRAGWVSGNDMVIMCQGSASATRDLAVHVYGTATAGTKMAKLDIVYTAGTVVTPDPVLVEAAVVQPAIALATTLAPVVVEATVVLPDIATPTEVIPDPVLIVATVIEPTISVGTPTEVALDPLLVEATVVQPSISMSLLPPETGPFVATQPGKTEVHFYDPTWVEVVPDEPVYLLNWETHRFQNRIGNWAASLPIDNGLIDGVPLHRYLRRGWHISFRQLNNHPLNNEDLWLLYQGVIQKRDYESQEDGPFLRLSGGMRELHLADRPTRRGLQFVGQAANIIGANLVDGDNIIGPGGGLFSPPLPSLSGTFKDPTTKFEALAAKVAGQARAAYRESWYYDRPEYTRIDNPPDSGITLRKAANFAETMTLTAEDGVGWIADPPSVRYDGSNIINRIIAIGSDTPEGDLTLGSATTSAPYPVQSFVNPDGSTSYYIEDTQSIERYGLVETYLVRTDVKNPSDNAGTRTAAANVLYATAAGELLKHKSEIMVVDLPVGNGADIWALPGDKIRLTFTGEVQTLSGVVTWIQENRMFMISERHDASTPSGVRQVRFVLQAPEIEMTIPLLPGAIILPPQNTDPSPFDPDSGGGDPDFPQSADCCDDPGTDIEESSDGDSPEIVPPEVISTPMSDPPPIGGGGTVQMRWMLSIVAGVVPAAPASLSFSVNEKTYTLDIDVDAGQNWPDGNPESDPPSGLSGVLIGTSEGQGYRWWFEVYGPLVAIPAHYDFGTQQYVLDISRAAAEALLGAPIDGTDFTWSQARSNADLTPYNGRRHGIATYYRQAGNPSLFVDDVASGDSYIWPLDDQYHGTAP